MPDNLHLVPPLGLRTTTPSWAEPSEPNATETPESKEVRAYLAECFFLLPHRVIYCPEHQCVVGMRGYMHVPDSYAQYPMLAIYFAKYRLRKYPFDTLRNDISWPEPYVVLNTIIRRLRAHRFLKGNDHAASIPDDIRKVIAPDLEIPDGMEGELLEVPTCERNVGVSQVMKVFEGDGQRQELESFFNDLFGPSHSELYPDSSDIRVVSDYPLRFSEDVTVFSVYLRKLWYIEKILVLANMVPESVMDRQDLKDSSVVWDILDRLEQEPMYEPSQDRSMTKAAALLKRWPDELDDFQQQRKDCRTFVYSKIRAWLPRTKKIKIYRGTSVLDDGSVKISLNFTEYVYIKSAYISLRPVSDREAPAKILTTFGCRHVALKGLKTHEDDTISLR